MNFNNSITWAPQLFSYFIRIRTPPPPQLSTKEYFMYMDFFYIKTIKTPSTNIVKDVRKSFNSINLLKLSDSAVT